MRYRRFPDQPIMIRRTALLLLCLSTPLLAAEDCANAINTYEIGQCLAEKLEQQEVEMQHYLAEARGRYAEDDQIVESIDQAQQSWLSYRQDQCRSTYTIWRDGTIRSLMGLNCSIRMTQLRTHQIWHSYLTYMEDKPPLLPEPRID